MANHHIRAFQNTVLAYYNVHSRYNLPWREIEKNNSIDPYKVMVSELMLQQTQVSRVIPKFTEFILQLPTVEALAKAQLSAVLTAWSGLGYYRRAKFLHHAAMTICADCLERVRILSSTYIIFLQTKKSFQTKNFLYWWSNALVAWIRGRGIGRWWIMVPTSRQLKKTLIKKVNPIKNNPRSKAQNVKLEVEY